LLRDKAEKERNSKKIRSKAERNRSKIKHHEIEVDDLNFEYKYRKKLK
jgi:hypothetical protein